VQKDPMIGKTVSHYKVVDYLGGGGMGVVYKAEDIKLKRTVALKFLPLEFTRNPEAKARFMKEAQAASALDHPWQLVEYPAMSDCGDFSGLCYIMFLPWCSVPSPC